MATGYDYDEVDRRFDHHPPTKDRVDEHAHIRSVVKNTAIRFVEALPEGREKSLALTKLEEALFWANAGIARQ